MTRVLILLLAFCFGKKLNADLLKSHFSDGSSEGYTLSMHSFAFAPNAGGQDVYGIRLSYDDVAEFSLFSNQYLLTGNIPLTGLMYGRRLSWCPRLCPIRTFVQVSAGISTGGPVLELLWSMTPFWVFRIDLATHYYVNLNRVIAWSYPFWLGVSIPF